MTTITALTDARAHRRLAARPLRLGERDLALLRWLARHRFATAAQVGERFAIGRNRCARRLGQLAAAGYVERREPFRAPSVYFVTRSGLKLAESELPPARLDVRTYRHDLGVVSLAVEFELAGLRTVTEREMRVREFTGLGIYAARYTPEPSEHSPRRHFADLAVEHGDGRLEVFELELTPKRSRRLRAILKAYRRSPHVSAVVYYVERPELGRRIEELARSLHVHDRISVRWW